jgi:hypothetical protein
MCVKEEKGYNAAAAVMAAAAEWKANIADDGGSWSFDSVIIIITTTYMGTIDAVPLYPDNISSGMHSGVLDGPKMSVIANIFKCSHWQILAIFFPSPTSSTACSPAQDKQEYSVIWHRYYFFNVFQNWKIKNAQ